MYMSFEWLLEGKCIQAPGLALCVGRTELLLRPSSLLHEGIGFTACLENKHFALPILHILFIRKPEYLHL
jgi:hypothetical protein